MHTGTLAVADEKTGFVSTKPVPLCCLLDPGFEPFLRTAFAVPITGARAPHLRTVAGAVAEALAGAAHPAGPINLPDPIEDVNGDAHLPYLLCGSAAGDCATVLYQ